MEGEPYKTMPQQGAQHAPEVIPEEKELPALSFIPAELLKSQDRLALGHREKCALVGLGIGVLAAISWIVVLFGVIFSIVGIILSVTGLKSRYKKYAQVGLGLSIVGLVASLWYVFAAWHGMINYNYFTTEFWGGGTTATTTTK